MFERLGPIDQTPGIPGSDKKLRQRVTGDSICNSFDVFSQCLFTCCCFAEVGSEENNVKSGDVVVVGVVDIVGVVGGGVADNSSGDNDGRASSPLPPPPPSPLFLLQPGKSQFEWGVKNC